MGRITAHFDLDLVKYGVASVGEERYIQVIHKESGREREFNTRTEFWGHHAKKAGGWLAQENEEREKQGKQPFLPEDFEIVDKQRLKGEPISHILNSAKVQVESIVKASGADRVQFYIGEGESFRTELSTILKYKGNREAAKPLLLDEVVEYLKKKYSPEVVTHLECDDRVNMEAYGKSNHFCIVVDKDGYGAGSKMFNPMYPEEGIVETNGFGKLWLEGSKKKIRGIGRKFKLWQITSLDESDNYRANCASNVKWAGMSAYKALVDCKDDKELFQSAYDVFKKLYPEPKIITGWRGDEFEIDALYVFQECFNMGHMLRWEGDRVVVKDVLDKLGVEY